MVIVIVKKILKKIIIKDFYKSTIGQNPHVLSHFHQRYHAYALTH